MRTVGIIALVLSFGVAFAMVSGSGVGAAIFGQENVDPGHAGELEQGAEQSDVETDEEGENSFEADVAAQEEPTITRFVFAGGQLAVSLVAGVALLPITLMRLGFPQYFAVPAGLGAQIIAGIGVFQFIMGREWL